MITVIVVALLFAVIVFQYMIIKIDKDKRHEAGHDKLAGRYNKKTCGRWIFIRKSW